MTQPMPTVQAAFGVNPGTVPTVAQWTDITDYVEVAGCQRGRSSETDTFAPGTFSALLKNRDRRFDPDYTSSPYYPNIKPMVRLRYGLGYMPLILADKPVSYWRLGEASGTTAADELAAFNGTYVNTPTLGIAGRITGNTAVTFNGSTQAVTAGDTHLGGTTAFTWEAWIKYTVSHSGVIFSESDTSTTNKYVTLLLASNKLEIDMRNDAGTESFFDATSGSALNDGNWHHVAVTRSGSTYTLFQDGVSVGSTTLTPGTITSATSTIGALRRTTNTGFFNGTIDEVAVYSRALSAAEILEHFNEGTAGYPDGWRFVGFVERWPQTWPTQVNEAKVPITAVDGFRALEKARLKRSVYEKEIRADSPLFWWRLGEPDGTTASATVGTITGTYRGTVTLAADGLIAQDTDTALNLDGTAANYASTGDRVDLGNTFSAECWIHPGTQTAADAVLLRHVQLGTGAPIFQLFRTNAASTLDFGITSAAGDTTIYRSTATVFDSNIHHIVVTYTGSTMKLYVDGVEGGSIVFGSAQTLSFLNGTLAVGSAHGSSGGYVGTIDEVAIYTTVLSAARVLAHYNAGHAPWNGDTTGTRVGRYLDEASWAAGDRNIDTGQSTMPSVALASSALSLIQAAEKAEQGAFFIQRDGIARFRQRHKVLTAAVHVTSQATFGDGGGSEIPYTELGEFAFSVDRIINEVHASRRGGTTYTVTDSASQTSHLAQVDDSSLTDMELSSDTEPLYAAQWRLAHYKDPINRPQRVTIKPATAAEWNAVLAREIGDRVTLKRRPPGGGAMISKDCLIERIEDANPEVGDYTISFDLSPAETQTYLVLDDATLGKLDTGRVAY